MRTPRSHTPSHFSPVCRTGPHHLHYTPGSIPCFTRSAPPPDELHGPVRHLVCTSSRTILRPHTAHTCYCTPPHKAECRTRRRARSRPVISFRRRRTRH